MTGISLDVYNHYVPGFLDPKFNIGESFVSEEADVVPIWAPPQKKNNDLSGLCVGGTGFEPMTSSL